MVLELWADLLLCYWQGFYILAPVLTPKFIQSIWTSGLSAVSHAQGASVEELWTQTAGKLWHHVWGQDWFLRLAEKGFLMPLPPVISWGHETTLPTFCVIFPQQVLVLGPLLPSEQCISNPRPQENRKVWQSFGVQGLLFWEVSIQVHQLSQA